ncbi:MAG TPA: hypothetical protein VND42_02195 [Candidatus Acidoferrales bacterium]|nr:hypothetical protein [Candidatus Acidoferrales bacterium]
MKRLLQFGCVIAIVAAASFSLLAAPQQRPELSTATPGQTPLSPAQIQDLLCRVIANQHRNDMALDTFERLEHHVERSSSNGRITEDRFYRVVPTGSGTLNLLVKENSHPVSAAEYQRQLRDWERVLQVAIHPDDPRELAAVAKQKKKLKDRERLINSVSSAYVLTWMGREVRDGRVLDQIQLNPNPAYQPRGDSTDWLAHARATIWVDASAGQLVRADASIVRDISIGAGILGKVYRGGHFIMEQAPIAPDIWEPSLYQYDISGRKFLFMFTLHEVTLLDHYRLIGSPDQALAIAQDDLTHCCSAFAGDP